LLREDPSKVNSGLMMIGVRAIVSFVHGCTHVMSTQDEKTEHYVVN